MALDLSGPRPQRPKTSGPNNLRTQDLRAPRLRAQRPQVPNETKAQDLSAQTSGPKTSGPRPSGPKPSRATQVALGLAIEQSSVPTVSLVHGAHVLDTTHLEEIRSVAQAYLLSASQGNHGNYCISSLHHSLGPGLSLFYSASGPYRGAHEGLHRGPRAQAWASAGLPSRRMGDTETCGVLRALPMSPPPSEAELKHLERRVELLTSYLWQCESLQPQALSLSALSRPQGFLLSLRRHYSQAQGTQLSATLHCCSSSLLIQTHSRALHTLCSPLPLLCISPRPITADAPGPGAPLIYFCPLYVEEELVAWVPLSSRLEPQTCSLRRVRIVSQL
uniref:Uncharacterized protein n=1 Tax=Knipowitschia caucasica TaxID=637954 RepID=A0AAV2LJQ8_KNICA